jgi:(p)ppGpp synthase/HD superfamily hydrolase
MMKKGEMLGAALVLAATKHAGTYDRGGKPYILHPLKVMHKLDSDDEELQCIAVLHDVVEDTDVTYADLREFGMSERVITGVRALTKVPGETLDEYKARVFACRDAMLVKMEDLRHNSDLKRLKGITEKDIARSAKYMVFYYEIVERMTRA